MAKRKREEVDDDSEDERPTGQAQILPVATKLQSNLTGSCASRERAVDVLDKYVRRM